MTFSLELSDDVIDGSGLGHDFAEKIVRARGAEWDAEETRGPSSMKPPRSGCIR